MKRRQFIGLFGAGMTLALGARAQAPQMRRICVLMSQSADDPNVQARLAAFRSGMEDAGWREGQSVQIEARWGGGRADEDRRHSSELIALRPDVLLASGSSAVVTLLQATSSIPIVFVVVPDPVGAGFVDSLARPGGNATGFAMFEYSIGAKWLELLKEISPELKRVAVLRDATVAAGVGQFGAIQAAAPALGVELSPIGIRDEKETEKSVAAFSRQPNSGLIVTGSSRAIVQRDLILSLAMQHKLPAIYYEQLFVNSGGLISYGPDLVVQHRAAATYVSRILKGEKPGDLPVQAPTKYRLAINLKTAKALGMAVPPTLIARADDVVE